MSESLPKPIENQEKVENTAEVQLDEQRRDFEIEIKGQRFGFSEIQPAHPSDTLLVHLPGFGEDTKQYIEPMHNVMGKSHCTLALNGYGETYSKEQLISALEQAIQKSGKQHVILHGSSFGAGVAYDLISTGEFVTRNKIVGAILETPFIDKKHLKSRVRSLPDSVLLRGSILFEKVRNLKSLAPSQEGLLALTSAQKRSIITEALREKTNNSGQKVTTPIHLIFVENESISDNEGIVETLQSQAESISFSTFPSADDNGHHIKQDAYEHMWLEEKRVKDEFTRK